MPFLVAAHLRAGTLSKVWELGLKKALQSENPGSGQSYKVVGLAFSPEAQQIVVRLSGKAVILQVKDPKSVLGQFQNLYHDSFGWSPDAQIIYSGGHIVRLADRTSCDLPSPALVHGFISGNMLAAQVFDASRGAPPLRFYDVECLEQDSREIPKSWIIGDVSPDRGLLSAWEITPSFPYGHKELIVSASMKKVLHSWMVESGPSGFFADGGRALCGGKICWDVDTGKQIGQQALGSISSRSGVAARSSRVVLDDRRESVRRVWDFRTSKELVSWKLRFITYSTTFDGDGFNRDRKPIPCAISPDGDYVVEGGDGRIWLYEIQL
jgi:hypothetical protein